MILLLNKKKSFCRRLLLLESWERRRKKQCLSTKRGKRKTVYNSSHTIHGFHRVYQLNPAFTKSKFDYGSPKSVYSSQALVRVPLRECVYVVCVSLTDIPETSCMAVNSAGTCLVHRPWGKRFKKIKRHLETSCPRVCCVTRGFVCGGDYSETSFPISLRVGSEIGTALRYVIVLVWRWCMHFFTFPQQTRRSEP